MGAAVGKLGTAGFGPSVGARPGLVAPGVRDGEGVGAGFAVTVEGGTTPE